MRPEDHDYIGSLDQYLDKTRLMFLCTKAHLTRGISEVEKYRQSLPPVSRRHSLTPQEPLSSRQVLARLTPLWKMFGKHEVSEWYRGTLMGQTLSNDSGLKRVYLDHNHDKMTKTRPLHVGIAYVRFSKYGRDRDRDGRTVISVVTAARLLLDLEREVGRLDIKYVSIFVGSPDEDSFMQAPPAHIATTTEFKE